VAQLQATRGSRAGVLRATDPSGYGPRRQADGLPTASGSSIAVAYGTADPASGGGGQQWHSLGEVKVVGVGRGRFAVAKLVEAGFDSIGDGLQIC
jgi:hypothetical protein